MRSCSVNYAPDLKRQKMGKPKHPVLNGNEREEHQRAGFALHLNLSALCADTATPHFIFLIPNFSLLLPTSNLLPVKCRFMPVTGIEKEQKKTPRSPRNRTAGQA